MAFRIHNWHEFQHYKERTPPWIKLHRGILNNRGWHVLTGDSSKLLVECWLIASEGDDPGTVNLSTTDLAWRLRRDERRVQKSLDELDRLGFIEPCTHDASNVLATCSPETEGETEKETEGEGAASAAAQPRKRKWTIVPDDWQPKESHQKLAAELGISLNVEAAKFRDHEFARPKSDPDRSFNRWLRQAKEFAGNRPPVGSEAAGWTNASERRHYDGHRADVQMRAGQHPANEGEAVRTWMRENRDEARQMYEGIMASLPPQVADLPPDEVEQWVLEALRKRIVSEKLRGVA